MAYINKATNLIYVNSANDFPAPSEGIITLENKVYLIARNITLSSSLAPPTSGSCSIIGEGVFVVGITYDGTGNFFTGTIPAGGYITVSNIIIVGNQSATLFNLDCTDANGFIYSFNCFFDNFGSMGTMTTGFISLAQVITENMGQGLLTNNAQGISFDGSIARNWENNADTYVLKTTGTVGLISINSSVALLNSNERFLDLTGTIGSSTIINITINDPDLFWMSGSYDQSHNPIFVSGNPGIPDSTVSAQFELLNNGNTNSMPVQYAWIIINASTWTSNSKERITGDGYGKATYTGIETIKVAVDGNIDLESALGNAKLLRARFINLHAHDSYTVTFTNGTNTINETATALSDGDTISFWNTAGTLPAELREDAIYYVVNKATDSFQVSYTSGGAAVAFTDDGTPTNSYVEAELIGSPGRGNIDNGDPTDVIPKALATIETNDQIIVAVQNETDANDINVINGYYRIMRV